MNKENKRVVEINEDCQFLKDLEDSSNKVNKGVYNLICTRRDLKLYIKHNIKPHRRWKITDVKKYFGLKGKGEKLLNDFLLMCDVCLNKVKGDTK